MRQVAFDVGGVLRQPLSLGGVRLLWEALHSIFSRRLGGEKIRHLQPKEGLGVGCVVGQRVVERVAERSGGE